MSEFFRETPFGHTVRLLTGNKVLQYPEERTDFQLPTGYSTSDTFSVPRRDGQSSQGADSSALKISENLEDQGRTDLEGALHNSLSTNEKVHAIVPSVSKDGTILVDWYSSDDHANPQNWSSKKKAFVAMQIWYALRFSPAKSLLLS